MTTTTSEFCEGLAETFPDVADILAEHISDNDELLPHLFLADVTRHVLADGKNRRPIVEYLETAFTSEGPDVENLIAVSFVEHLEDRDELERATSGLTTPRIRAEWDRQRAM
jgi:hypothetical protein